MISNPRQLPLDDLAEIVEPETLQSIERQINDSNKEKGFYSSGYAAVNLSHY